MNKRTCQHSSTDKITHVLYLPSLCPVSKNPLTGSYIAITYNPTSGLVLDVDLLAEQILSYKDGSKTGTRDMETTIQELTEFAALRTEARVSSVAVLKISTSPKTEQLMIVRCAR